MKKIILLIIIVIPLAYGCKSVWVDDKQPVPIDTKVTLTKLLGEDIEFEKIGDDIVINYCPDNTCESFSSVSPASFSKLLDFSFTYLFYVSEYYALEDFKTVGEKHVSETLERYSNFCPNKEIEKAKCVLRKLAETYKIEVKFIRYDEKQKNEVPVDLEFELNRLKSE